MTKHKENQPSVYLPKMSIDWCHACGVRTSPSIEISYPENAEAEHAKTIVQGSRHAQYIHDDVIKEADQYVGDDKFIRLCKKCLKYCIYILDKEEKNRNDFNRRS